MVPTAEGGFSSTVGAEGGFLAFDDPRSECSCPGTGGCSGAAATVMPDAGGNSYWLPARATSTRSAGAGVKVKIKGVSESTLLELRFRSRVTVIPLEAQEGRNGR
jgi:hypothetical protein